MLVWAKMKCKPQLAKLQMICLLRDVAAEQEVLVKDEASKNLKVSELWVLREAHLGCVLCCHSAVQASLLWFLGKLDGLDHRAHVLGLGQIDPVPTENLGLNNTAWLVTSGLSPTCKHP